MENTTSNWRITLIPIRRDFLLRTKSETGIHEELEEWPYYENRHEDDKNKRHCMMVVGFGQRGKVVTFGCEDRRFQFSHLRSNSPVSRVLLATAIWHLVTPMWRCTGLTSHNECDLSKIDSPDINMGSFICNFSNWKRNTTTWLGHIVNEHSVLKIWSKYLVTAMARWVSWVHARQNRESVIRGATFTP